MALYSCKRNSIPSKGNTPGDVYYSVNSGETFLVCSDLTLLDLGNILRGSLQVVREVGPKGERGDRGHQGERGLPGKDGADGKDSQVPGPAGAQGSRGNDGLPGTPGRDGKDGKDGANGRNGKDGAHGRDGKDGLPGDVLYVGPDELKAATETARQALLARRAAVRAAIHQARIDATRLDNGTRAVLFNALRDVENANNA